MSERIPGRGRWRRCAVCHLPYIADLDGYADHETAEGHKPFRYRLRPRKQVPLTIRRAVYERDNFTCRECGFRPDEWVDGPKVRSEGNFLTLDHSQPWALGGTNDETNLATLCWDCNQVKAEADRARVHRILDYLAEIGDPHILPREAS